MSDPASDASSADVTAVRAVALDYIEGWYTADAERMARALHDDLVKRTPAEDDGPVTPLRVVSKETMIELTRAGGGRDVADPGIEVHVDHVFDDIASAHTVCVDFVDHLQLVRTTGGWKIANILFRNRG